MVENKDFRLEYRWGDNDPEQFATLVSELLGRSPALLAGDSIAMLAAKATRSAVPIIFVAGGNPVDEGLVTNFSRPGGSVTGIHFLSVGLGAKRLDLLRHVLPPGTTIAMLVKPNTGNSEAERSDIVKAAATVRQRLITYDINNEAEIEAAFERFASDGVGAVIVGGSAFFNSKRERLVDLLRRYRLPSIFHVRASAVAGGLMSYGGSISDAYRQAGVYASRILKGEKPGELPVISSNQPEFVLNLKTAKALGLEIPPGVIAIADEVIE